MPIRKIIIEPDPILRKKSESLEKVDNELRKLMDDMLKTMYAAPGIGLAAVQVGILKRLIVVDVSKDDKKKGYSRYYQKDEGPIDFDYLHRLKNELQKINNCCLLAKKLNIEVHAGHGLDYKSCKVLSKNKIIKEFNIGHFIIGESIMFGMKKVISNFRKILN